MSDSAPKKPQASPQPTRPIVVVGMKPAEPPPEPKKLIENAATAAASFLSPLKSKFQQLRAGMEVPTRAEPRPVEPPKAEEPAPAAAEPLAPAPVSRPASGRIPLPKVAGTVDHVVLRVAPGTGQKAHQTLGRKGIRDAKLEGDTLEFEIPTNRLLVAFKGLLEAHVEPYGLERTTKSEAHEPPKS